MAAQEGKGSVRKSNKMIVKTSLNNPFALHWSRLEQVDTRFILETLKERMKEIGLRKVEARKRKMPRSRKKHDQEESIQDKNETSETKHGWTDQNNRNQLAIGINEVTKGLEKNELLLVLVCKSAKPIMMTSHLILLSASRDIPAGQVPRLSETLGSVLGLTSVLALGFKRNTDTFAEIAKLIIPRIPSLDVPWIAQSGNKQSQGSEDKDLSDEDLSALESALAPESKGEECSPHLKRKRLDSGKLTSPTVTLQALAVKKIVPNPSKMRKLRKTKKRISK